jgi:hypothetical protein
LPNLISRGLSAAVFTQTTDVEIEINGLTTYDRKVLKMQADSLNLIHQKLYNTALGTIKPGAETTAVHKSKKEGTLENSLLQKINGCNYLNDYPFN